ncbi:hypothetical protein H5410_047849 [Solanum commersonii]|uniref:Uncharacterized protein n=1 Tax=Solanum commersonii TaxID=4109 RepID=A0A9J5XIJ7_SOLCO|nr:hypothetical protein H5410_047849 [Solanum commersonii]
MRLENTMYQMKVKTLIIQPQRKRTRKVNGKNLMAHPMQNKIKAQCQIYHDLPPFVSHDHNPCYFQQYFFDIEYKLSNRISKVKEGILSDTVAKKIK